MMRRETIDQTVRFHQPIKKSILPVTVKISFFLEIIRLPKLVITIILGNVAEEIFPLHMVK